MPVVEAAALLSERLRHTAGCPQYTVLCFWVDIGGVYKKHCMLILLLHWVENEKVVLSVPLNTGSKLEGLWLPMKKERNQSPS